MTVSEFADFRKAFDRECAAVLFSKMNDYAAEADAHQNFKQSAEASGMSPLQVWSIFFKKHLDAIFTYVRDGQVASEPVRQRMLDARNYIDLGLALIADGRAQHAVADALLGDRTEAFLGDAR